MFRTNLEMGVLIWPEKDFWQVQVQKVPSINLFWKDMKTWIEQKATEPVGTLRNPHENITDRIVNEVRTQVELAVREYFYPIVYGYNSFSKK